MNYRRLNGITVALLFGTAQLLQAQQNFPFRNPDLPLEVRVNDLIGRMTLEEKVEQMKHAAPAIERLGVPAYNWWNETLHGVARTKEKTTVFPQAIAMAATFDAEAIQRMGDISATEGRALFNEDLKNNKTGEIYRGLTYWTPNINIFRDPRWGRGQETYGEDPYLTSVLGCAIVRGLEGNDPRYLKAVACAKHYAVHSGPETSRHSYDARVSAYDLWDTYLPAFRALVTKAKVHGVMCAYNRMDGEPCCGNNKLLSDILRNQWKFDGYVTSDCWAVADFMKYHKTHSSNLDAVTDAVLSGTDLECGDLYQLLAQSVRRGQITERDINVSLKRLFEIRLKLGMFDPADRVPYASIGKEVLECDAHKAHARSMAQKSIVLLKNQKNTLPLNPKKIKRIALIGPNADNGKTQLGNYNGFPSEIVTPKLALEKRFGDQITIDYLPGCGVVAPLEDAPTFTQIAAKAKKADVIVFVGGINSELEGEEGDAGKAPIPGFYGGDRTTMSLPTVQTDLMKALAKTGKPLVVVNMSGSVINFEWESAHASALLQAWYGGQAGGDAIVDVLFGEYNPSGRMPLTTYMSDQDLPDFENYSMENRTYRYFKGDVRYPFGYGLSYTRFAYDALTNNAEYPISEQIKVSVKVSNVGNCDGDEVVQLYLSHPASKQRTPISALKGFQRIHLKKGESQIVTFLLQPEDLAMVDEKGNLIEQEGLVNIYIGGGQQYHSDGVAGSFSLKGSPYQL